MATACQAASRASGRWTSILWLTTWQSGESWPHVSGPAAPIHRGRCNTILTSRTAACVRMAMPGRPKPLNVMYLKAAHRRLIVRQALTPGTGLLKSRRRASFNHSNQEAMQVREVGDGNINYVYIVEGPSGGVVVKQGLPYIRIAHDWPLTQVSPAPPPPPPPPPPPTTELPEGSAHD